MRWLGVYIGLPIQLVCFLIILLFSDRNFSFKTHQLHWIFLCFIIVSTRRHSLLLLSLHCYKYKWTQPFVVDEICRSRLQRKQVQSFTFVWPISWRLDFGKAFEKYLAPRFNIRSNALAASTPNWRRPTPSLKRVVLSTTTTPYLFQFVCFFNSSTNSIAIAFTRSLAFIIAHAAAVVVNHNRKVIMTHDFVVCRFVHALVHIFFMTCGLVGGVGIDFGATFDRSLLDLVL